MIGEYLMLMVVQVLGIFSYVFPLSDDGTLKIPWGLDDILITGVTGFKALATAFPPFNDIMTAFIIYLTFRIIMRLGRMIPLLGRTLG